MGASLPVPGASASLLRSGTAAHTRSLLRPATLSLKNIMAIRKRMNHVAAGLLDSFYSRCNALQGYWALGMLYEEVPSAPYRVTLDLLARTAAPAGPRAELVAARYGDFLTLALLKKNLRVEALTEATVALQFKADIPRPRLPPHCIGEAFACTVTLRGAGSLAQYTAVGACLPNDTRLFRQGGRQCADEGAAGQPDPVEP